MGLEYLGGFFDGEGYVGVVHDKTSDRYALRVCVSNNDVRALQLFVDEFGGDVIPRKQYGQVLNAWFWLVHGKKAQGVLKRLLPYLVLKTEETDLALQFPISSGGRRLTEEEKNQQACIYRQLIAIKEKRSTLDMRTYKREWDGNLLERPEVRRAIELYQNGLTQEKVAEAINSEFGMNIGYSWVSYWLRSTGNNISRSDAHKRQHANKSFTDQQKLAAKMYLEGASYRRIAQQIGVSEGSIYNWLEKQGITRSLQQSQRLRRQREKEAQAA